MHLSFVESSFSRVSMISPRYFDDFRKSELIYREIGPFPESSVVGEGLSIAGELSMVEEVC